MSDPQYGTQTVRFVETAQVAATNEIDQFRVCQRVGDKNPTEIRTTISFPATNATQAPTTGLPTVKLKAIGVTQQRLRAVPTDTRLSEQNSGDNLRLVAVATSGNLLVEMDKTSGSPLDVGDSLSVDTSGRASKAATATAGSPNAMLVDINGTTPTVRSIVKLGPKQYALVSFT